MPVEYEFFIGLVISKLKNFTIIVYLVHELGGLRI